MDKLWSIHTVEYYSAMKKECRSGASLVAQWQRIHLPMQETWV